MRLRILITAGIVQCCCLLLQAQVAGQPASQGAQAQSTAKTTKQTASHAAPDDPGERKFRANCSRCHNAPEELSPRISGTVLLHMRVRASLSEADERAILHYLMQ
jgi:cytochrome c5